MKNNVKRVVALLVAFLLGVGSFSAVGNSPTVVAYAQEYIYYATLDISSKGWSSYNTGLNYNMTGGTAGTIRQGAKLSVISEKVNKNGNKVAYVYSEDLKKNCYVSVKYLKKVETTETVVDSEVNAVLDFGTRTWTKYYPGENKEFTGGTPVPSGLKEGTELQIVKKVVNSNGTNVAYCYVPCVDTYCYISMRVVKELEVESTTKESATTDSYTYDGKEYLLVEGYSEDYIFNQRDYDRFLKNGKNVGCTATALATAYSIYNNTFLSPDSESIKWTTGVGVTWGPQTKWTGYASNNLVAAYDYLQKDIPVILRLKKGDSGHSVTLVGVAKNADRNNLCKDDFLVIDPWGGVVWSLEDAASGYTLHTTWELIIPVKQ